MLATGVYLILFTMANKHLSSAIVTERNSAIGKSMNHIHLCKILRLGLWISLNLSLEDFLEIVSLNSTLLKFLIAINSGKQDLEKSKSSLKQERSQPNDFLNRQNFTNNFLPFSTISKVVRKSRVKRRELWWGSSCRWSGGWWEAPRPNQPSQASSHRRY
jgi:hypothetical protein